MKNLFIFSILTLILSACGNVEDKSTTDNPTNEEPTKTVFENFDVDEAFSENPFTWFKGPGLLLAVGDREKSNAMTIGWGALGNLWGHTGANAVTVYVAEGRYTYQFIESSKYFTVMAFDDNGTEILKYMGTHSGRDEDKAAALGLHTLYTDNGTPYYEEASVVLECEIIYKAPFEKDGMCEAAQKFYENFSAGVHHMYIGNVVNAFRKVAAE